MAGPVRAGHAVLGGPPDPEGPPLTAAVLRAALHVRLRSAAGDFSLDAELEVPAGITSVIGDSGAGKSTLLAALAGLIRPESGLIAVGDSVWLDTGRGIDRPGHLRRLAMVFQNPALFPHLTALGNVEFALARELSRRERRRRAAALLDQMRVGHLGHRRPHNLSGGEAQRVGLARALARSPQLVLLDEPFSALDRRLRRTLAEEVRDHVRSLGVPVLFVTHNLEEARALGDRALLVEDGVVRSTAFPLP